VQQYVLFRTATTQHKYPFHLETVPSHPFYINKKFENQAPPVMPTLRIIHLPESVLLGTPRVNTGTTTIAPIQAEGRTEQEAPRPPVTEQYSGSGTAAGPSEGKKEACSPPHVYKSEPRSKEDTTSRNRTVQEDYHNGLWKEARIQEASSYSSFAIGSGVGVGVGFSSAGHQIPLQFEDRGEGRNYVYYSTPSPAARPSGFSDDLIAYRSTKSSEYNNVEGQWYKNARDSIQNIRSAPLVAAGQQDVSASASNKNAGGANKKQSLRQQKSADAFHKRFNDLMAFRAKHGNCDVPESSEYISLARWCNVLRVSYRKIKNNQKARMKLSAENIHCLNEVGFKWCRRRGWAESFIVRFHDLMQYKATHGHCDVPHRSNEYNTLGQWCSNVRQSYTHILMNEVPPMNLTDAQIQRLSDAGFNWWNNCAAQN
jgi:hypothetical protein